MFYFGDAVSLSACKTAISGRVIGFQNAFSLNIIRYQDKKTLNVVYLHPNPLSHAIRLLWIPSVAEHT